MIWFVGAPWAVATHVPGRRLEVFEFLIPCTVLSPYCVICQLMLGLPQGLLAEGSWETPKET